jgi:hypothetical protein
VSRSGDGRNGDVAVVGPDDTFSAASIKEDLRCKIQDDDNDNDVQHDQSSSLSCSADPLARAKRRKLHHQSERSAVVHIEFLSALMGVWPD